MTNPAPVTNVYRSAKVMVRHGIGCNQKKTGDSFEDRKCNCRKSLFLYDPNGIQTKAGLRKQVKISAKTTNWDEAEAMCREWLESFDPDKIKIQRLTALVQPVVILVMAGMVGVIAYSIINGIFDAVSGLRPQ